MRALVIWESAFGNTRKIAESIAEGLAPTVTATTAEAGRLDAGLLDGIDLLVVGAPTHMFGLPSARSRQNEIQQVRGEWQPAAGGVREWLAAAPPVGRRTVVAAAFDTRFAKPHWVTGSAARATAKQLKDLGYRVVATESFFVARAEGPLLRGEFERAHGWAEGLAATLTSVSS
ncbi:MAG TPA: flavodoxin domain-containing protein [Pseudonocardiaceae bacterium]|nr:flavodoxin domain-containing protein [Pseudonocardiaceae bacterium]